MNEGPSLKHLAAFYLKKECLANQSILLAPQVSRVVCSSFVWESNLKAYILLCVVRGDQLYQLTDELLPELNDEDS